MSHNPHVRRVTRQQLSYCVLFFLGIFWIYYGYLLSTAHANEPTPSGPLQFYSIKESMLWRNYLIVSKMRSNASLETLVKEADGVVLAYRARSEKTKDKTEGGIGLETFLGQ